LENTRLYFADWIRIIVVLSLIPFHTALSYSGYGDVYVYDPRAIDYYLGNTDIPGISSLPFDLYISFLDNFFMHLLFFVSGLGSYFALQKRTAGEYVKERFLKLFLPLAVSIVTVIPVISYIRNINLYGFKDSYIDFFPQFFNGIRGSFEGANLEWAHLWFLIYLFVISLICLPLFLFMKKPAVREKLSGISHTGIILLPLALILPLEALLRPTWPGFQNLYDDWANLTNYMLFFTCGYAAGCIPKLLEKLKKYGIQILLAGFAAYICKELFYEFFAFERGYNLYSIIAIILRNISAYLFVAGFTGIAYKYLKRQSITLAYLTGSSYTVYIFHFIPVTIITYLLLGSSLHYYIRFLTAVLVSVPVLFVIYEIIKRVPGVRFLFAVKKPSKI
jgi:glucans biosynthesis protein C